MRTSEIPEQLLKLLTEDVSEEGYTSTELADQLGAAERTLRKHLLALHREGRVTRTYRYDGPHGAFRYTLQDKAPARR